MYQNWENICVSDRHNLTNGQNLKVVVQSWTLCDFGLVKKGMTLILHKQFSLLAFRSSTQTVKTVIKCLL